MAGARDFIYVGAPKAGSSWLFEALSAHPETWLLPSKSSGFFETGTAGDIESYRRLFAGAESDIQTGEIAHDAYLYPGTARRLREAFPGVKVIVCLREPGAFAASVLRWWTNHTSRFGKNADDMAQSTRFRGMMDYRGCLARFYRELPAEQIKICFFEDLTRNPEGFFRDICRFLGLSTDFVPSSVYEVVNPTRPARFPVLTGAIYRAGGAMRALGLGNAVERVKRTSMLQPVLYAPNAARPDPAIDALAENERAQASRWLGDLEKMIGKPVPAEWRERAA